MSLCGKYVDAYIVIYCMQRKLRERERMMKAIRSCYDNKVLHIEKGESYEVKYSDGTNSHTINRCIWTAKEDGSTWAKFCGQWNRVYKNRWWYVGWYYDDYGNFIARGDFAEEVSRAA